VTLTGLTTLDLDSAAQLSVIQATASSMQVDQSTLTYVTTNAASRRLTAWRTSDVNGIAVVNAAIPLSSTTYTSTTDLYNGVNANLQTAITTTAYTGYLQTYSTTNGATATANADGTAASSSPAVVVNPPSNNDDDSLNDGQIAGIVIGTIFGFALICALVYYVVFKDGGSATFPSLPSVGSFRSNSNTGAGSRQRREDVEIAL
jgi:Tfp pilus assembly major pilin PilA